MQNGKPFASFSFTAPSLDLWEGRDKEFQVWLAGSQLGAELSK